MGSRAPTCAASRWRRPREPGIGTGGPTSARLRSRDSAACSCTHAIGSGLAPGYNFDEAEVASDVTDLHANGIDASLMLTEAGGTVPSNEHDILTGSNGDGTALETFPGNPTAPGPTCLNWTSSDSNAYGWVGHADWVPGQSWNSAHEVQCDQAGLAATAGSGRLYCFAVSETPLFRDGFEAGS